MKVFLRVYSPRKCPRLFEKWRKPLPEPEVEERIYTPATLDLSTIAFAYVDNDGDIVIHKKGDNDVYALEYSEDLFNAINKFMDSSYKKISGFVDNRNVD